MGRKTYKNRWKKNLLTFFSIFLILLSACGNGPPEAEVQSGSAGKIEELEVHFIDVGQGDATLVKCGGQSMSGNSLGENACGTNQFTPLASI